MADGKETLDSWKEIASYFDRTVRTVQNWEKYGLPVVRDEQTGRVCAYVAELEDWRNRSDSGVVDNAIDVGSAGIVREALFPQSRRQGRDVAGRVILDALQHVDQVGVRIDLL